MENCIDDEPLPAIELQLPDYCDYYKPLLVENFSYNPSPLQLHYGKCSLIGRTLRDPQTAQLCLGSTRLIGLDLQYQCPDNSTRVPLHMLAASHVDMPANETVQIFGEAQFFDSGRCQPDDEKQVILLTTKDLIMRMIDFRDDADQETQMDESYRLQRMHVELDSMRQRYVPVMSVHSFNAIDQPQELLQMQLRLGSVRARRDRCCQKTQPPSNIV